MSRFLTSSEWELPGAVQRRLPRKLRPSRKSLVPVFVDCLFGLLCDTWLSGTGDYVVKAQVLAGGRGLGIFTSGFKGGVHPCTTYVLSLSRDLQIFNPILLSNSPEEVKDIAAKMLGFNLRTKQTSADGQLCSKVLVCERLYLRREMYFAIVLDREHGVLLSRGGLVVLQ